MLEESWVEQALCDNLMNDLAQKQGHRIVL
jgi:hypothetical protein